MVDPKRQFAVGLFLLLAAVVCTIMVFEIGDQKSFLARSHKIFARYKRIQGLKTGAPVHLAGINVGYVHDISFVPTEEGMEVLVSLKISDKYFYMVREDSIARIVTQGILGDKYIQISLGSVDKPELEPDGFVRTKEYSSVIDKLGEGGSFFESVESVLQGLEDTLSQLNEGRKLEKILKNIESASGKIRDVSRKLSSDKTLMGQMLSPTTEGRVDKIVGTLEDIAESLSKITKKIDDGTGTIGALVNDPTLYNDIRQLVGGARRHSLIKYVVRESLKKAEKAEFKP